MTQRERDGDDTTWNPEEMERFLNDRDSREGFYERHKMEESWSRFMFGNLASFFGVDLYICTKFHNCDNHREETQQLSRRRRHSNLSRIVKGLYVWANVRILILLALQYRFDYHELQRDRLIKHLAELSVHNKTGFAMADSDKQHTVDYNSRIAELTATVSELSYDLVADRKWLKMVGTPYLEYEFGSECVAIICVLLGLSLYLQVNWLHDNTLPANFSLLRMLLDRESERKNLIKMTVNEVDKFLASSYEYALVQAQSTSQRHRQTHRRFFLGCTNNYKQSVTSFKLQPILHSNRSTVASAISMHRKTISRIKQLFIDGKLEPFNRDAKTLHRFSIYSVVVAIFISWNLVLYNTCNTQLLPLMFCDRLDFAGFMDYLCSVEISLLGYLTCIWATFGMSVMIIHLTDFISTLMKLSQQIKQFLGKSIDVSGGHGEHQCPSLATSQHQLQQQTTSKSCSNTGRVTSRANVMTQDQLESQLLIIYLQYRFLKRQLDVTRPLFGFYLASASQVMLIIPILMFVHYPYIQFGRPIFIVLASAYLFCGDLCILPVCYMHGRCLDMYRLLFSIFAHVISLRCTTNNEQANSIASNQNDHDDEIDSHNTFGRVDLFSHGHTMWLLHRELNAPDRLANQFVFRQYGVANTYPNVMKLHFYLGLLMLFSLLLGSRIDVTTQEAAFLSSSFNLI